MESDWFPKQVTKTAALLAEEAKHTGNSEGCLARDPGIGDGHESQENSLE